MKIDIDKLIKLNALASKHFHKKHTIILPPGEKINFNNALGIEDEQVLFLKEVMHILEEYNLDSQGIFEYMKEIIDIKLGSETRRKIWKRIDGEDSHRESTRYIRCLIVNINGKEYLVDGDQRIIREFQREEEENKRGSFIPYSALSRGDYDYYNGK